MAFLHERLLEKLKYAQLVRGFPDFIYKNKFNFATNPCQINSVHTLHTVAKIIFKISFKLSLNSNHDEVAKILC